MSLIKLNNRAVKDVTQFGSISSLGSLTHISTATASASASIEFTSGIDSTYKEYVFYFNNIHGSIDDTDFSMNFSTDSGSNYNVTKTTTVIRAEHAEADDDNSLSYRTDKDLAQSTSNQVISERINTDQNDASASGYLHLFNPSSTTFVKHFISNFQNMKQGNYSMQYMVAGYGNTTSAINAIKFQMSSGNIDAGQILLFGVN
jgi:hypothetical protein